MKRGLLMIAVIGLSLSISSCGHRTEVPCRDGTAVLPDIPGKQNIFYSPATVYELKAPAAATVVALPDVPMLMPFVAGKTEMPTVEVRKVFAAANVRQCARPPNLYKSQGRVCYVNRLHFLHIDPGLRGC